MQTEVFLQDFKNIRTFVARFGRDDRSAQVGGSERIAKRLTAPLAARAAKAKERSVFFV